MYTSTYVDFSCDRSARQFSCAKKRCGSSYSSLGIENATSASSTVVNIVNVFFSSCFLNSPLKASLKRLGNPAFERRNERKTKLHSVHSMTNPMQHRMRGNQLLRLRFLLILALGINTHSHKQREHLAFFESALMKSPSPLIWSSFGGLIDPK